MSLGKRIKKIREKIGINQLELAEMLKTDKDISQATVSSWENSTRKPDYDMLIRIAEIGSVSLDWLLKGKESDFKPPVTSSETLAGEGHKPHSAFHVPVVSTVTAGDTGAILEESNIMYMAPVPDKPSDTAIMLEVQGDSMMRERGRSINPGDLVYIDTKETSVFDGDLVVVTTLDGRQLIKQYRNHDKDTIELRSFNPDYPPIYIPKSDIVSFFRVLQVHPKIWKP